MSEGSGNEGRGGTHTALRRTDRTRLEPHFDLYTEPACSGYNQTGNYVTCGDRRGDRTLRTSLRATPKGPPELAREGKAERATLTNPRA